MMSFQFIGFGCLAASWGWQLAAAGVCLTATIIIWWLNRPSVARRRSAAAIGAQAAARDGRQRFHVTFIDGRAFGESGMSAAICPLEISEQFGGVASAAIIGRWRLSEDDVESARRAGRAQMPCDFLNEPDKFIENTQFIRILHEVIASAPPSQEVVREVVGPAGKGDLAVIDQRNPGAGNTMEFEDIFGWFRVEDGGVTHYEQNAEHRLFTNRGLFQLPPPRVPHLLNALRSLPRD